MANPEVVNPNKAFEDHVVFKSDDMNFYALSLAQKFKDQLKKTDAFRKAVARSFLLDLPERLNQPKKIVFPSGSNIAVIKIYAGGRLEIDILKSLASRITAVGKIKEPLEETLEISPATSQTLPFVAYIKVLSDGAIIRIDNNAETLVGAEGMLKTLKKGARKIPLFRR